MAVQQVGLRAVFDVSGFASNVSAYIRNLNIVQNANSQLAASSRSMGTAVSAGIGGAIGAATIAALSQLGGAIRSVGDEIFDTLKFFEQLTFSLETMLAIQGKNAGEFATVAEGLTQTSQAAQEYLLWLQELAIFSPFTTEQIATGNQLLQVYRFTAQEAASLTKLLVDYASASGRTSVALDRISLAVGQIRTEGRLLARDALQLTQAGIPIYDFLAQYTGQTVQSLLELQKKGMLPARTAIEALVAGLQDFEGSGKRVSGTISGLFSSLEDIRQISSRNLFKGIFEGIRPELQQLVDTLTSADARARIVVLGEEIGEVFGQIVDDAREMAGSVARAIGALSTPFKEGVVIFAAAALGLTAFVGTVGLLSVAIGAVVTPFTLAVAAVAGFATLYIQNFTTIQRTTQNVSTFIQGVLRNIERAFTTLSDHVGSALESASLYISNFAMDVTDWGSNIVGSLADGITQGVGLITQAINAVGSVISFLMAPGSPPRFLPELDQWGTDAAQVYLDAWGEADFDAINRIGSTIGGLLKSMAGAGQIEELSVPRIMAGTRQAYAEAIDQITKTGSVSQEMLDKVRRAAGPAGDAVGQTLLAFIKYRAATIAVETAQEKLNAVTQKYKELITPIRAEMERISELRRNLSEENEIRSLQRLLARGGIRESLRQESLARIQEIQQGRKLRGLEKQEQAALDAGNAELDAVKKQQDAAEKQVKLIEARIQAQTDANNLVADELRILEQIRKEQERLAKEAERLRKEQLEKQLKIAQLMLAEVKDTVGVFKAQYTLADDTATAIEKQNAALELQAILGRRIVRNDEARELGIPQEELNRLRDIPVTLEDAGIKVKEAAESVEDGIRGLGEMDLTSPFEELNKAIDDVRLKFEEARISLDEFVTRVDTALPSFLKIRGEGEETAPIMDTLGSALAGLGAGLLTGRVISILTGLPAMIGRLHPVSATIITVISVLTAAWTGNWFNIREHTATGVAFVSQKMTELVNNPMWGRLQTELLNIGNNIRAFFLEGGLAAFIENNSVLSAIAGFITGTLIPAIQQVIPAIQRFGAILGVIFAPLAEGFTLDNIVAAFSNLGAAAQEAFSNLPEIISGFFTGLVATVRERAPVLVEAFLNFLPTIPTRLLAGLLNIGTTIVGWLTDVVPVVASKALELGTAFLQWLGPLAGQAIVGLGKLLGALLRWTIGTAVPFLFRSAVFLGKALLSFIDWAITEFPAFALKLFTNFTIWMITQGVPMLLTAAGKLAVALLGFITRSEEEVGPSLSKFLTAANNWIATNIVPALYQAMLEVGRGIILGLYDAFGQENVDPVLETIRGAFEWIAGVFETVGTWIDTAVKLFGGWAGAVGDIFGDIVTTAKAIIKFSQGFGRAFDELWDGVMKFIFKVIQGWVNDFMGLVKEWSIEASNAIIAIQNLFAPATQMAIDVFNAVVQYFNELKIYFGGIITYLAGLPAQFIAQTASIFSTITLEAAKWLTTLTTQIGIWGSALATTITGFVTSVWTAAQTLGTNIVNGLVQGINSLVNAPRTALKNLLFRLLGFGQEEIEAHSPSELFAREIGAQIPAGIAQGIAGFDIGSMLRGLGEQALGLFGFTSMGQTVGKALADGIVAGFVANETNLILGIEQSLTRVAGNLPLSLLTGSSVGDMVAATGAYAAGSANFLPSDVNNSVREIHYHLNVRTEATSQGVVEDFNILRTLEVGA